MPMIVVVPSAFGARNALSFPPSGFTPRWFEVVFNRPEFLSSLAVSIGVGLFATVVSLCLGIPAAVAVVRYRNWFTDLLGNLFMLPAIVLSVPSSSPSARSG